MVIYAWCYNLFCVCSILFELTFANDKSICQRWRNESLRCFHEQASGLLALALNSITIIKRSHFKIYLAWDKKNFKISQFTDSCSTWISDNELIFNFSLPVSELIRLSSAMCQWHTWQTFHFICLNSQYCIKCRNLLPSRLPYMTNILKYDNIHKIIWNLAFIFFGWILSYNRNELRLQPQLDRTILLRNNKKMKYSKQWLFASLLNDYNCQLRHRVNKASGEIIHVYKMF